MENNKERMGGKGGVKMPKGHKGMMPKKGMKEGARVSHGPGTAPKGKGAGKMPKAKKAF